MSNTEQNFWMAAYLLSLCPPTRGGKHIDFGADPIGIGFGTGIGIGVTFLSAQYLVNQWLDSYQIFMET